MEKNYVVTKEKRRFVWLAKLDNWVYCFATTSSAPHWCVSTIVQFRTVRGRNSNRNNEALETRTSIFGLQQPQGPGSLVTSPIFVRETWKLLFLSRSCSHLPFWIRRICVWIHLICVWIHLICVWIHCICVWIHLIWVWIHRTCGRTWCARRRRTCACSWSCSSDRKTRLTWQTAVTTIQLKHFTLVILAVIVK